jgi:hypothetical protein
MPFVSHLLNHQPLVRQECHGEWSATGSASSGSLASRAAHQRHSCVANSAHAVVQCNKVTVPKTFSMKFSCCALAPLVPVQQGPDEVERQVGGDQEGGGGLDGEQALAPLLPWAHAAGPAVRAGPACSSAQQTCPNLSHNSTPQVACTLHSSWHQGTGNVDGLGCNLPATRSCISQAHTFTCCR